ncbi:MAG: hypothetical protein KJ047_03645 [Anaerolineae bacterium]|nr:hypothetical protein [Anaerolineae bacterium]
MNQVGDYPDILGQLSGERLTVGDLLQGALGVFPPTTALDQTVEVLFLLQNMTNRPLALRLIVRPPARDSAGSLANFFTPRPRLALTLPPAECGLVHIPVTPQLPTRPGEGYLIQVAVEVTPPDRYQAVRPVAGGAPPSLLALSPFRVAVLRDIHFTARETAPSQLAVALDVLPGRFPPRSETPQPRYEALWTLHDLRQEAQQVEATAAEARKVARALSPALLYVPLLEHTNAVFGEAGMPLHPGEALFITRALMYVLQDGLDLEQGFSREQSAWFKRLCRLLVADPQAAHAVDQLVSLLYTAAVYDAVLLGFHVAAGQTNADFGDKTEQSDYTARLIAALEGRATLRLEHVYVPLVLAGVALHGRVTLPGEKPWQSLVQVQQARDGRIKLAGAEFAEVFELLNTLIEQARQLLIDLRVPRD